MRAYHQYGVICLKKRQGGGKKVLSQISWPENPATELRVTISGSDRALIENHRGIIEFSDSRVRLKCPGGETAVNGNGLSLEQISGTSLMVVGRICGVALPEGGDDHI